MVVKINDIVRMEKFAGTRIISGVNGSNNKVNSVNIMEVPDIIHYTSPNALLFTTLYPIINDPKALRDFIPSLVENNLAGVAIKLGRYIDEVPDYMIQQSNELNFPILILPPSADFSILTNKILVELLGMKTSILEFREKITAQFQQLLLTSGDMKKFVKLTSENVHADVFILKNNLQIMESSNEGLKEKYNSRKKEFMDPRRYLADDTELLSKDLQRLFFRKYIDVYSIRAGDKLLGYMVILSQQSDLADKKYQVVIEQAIILLAFLFQSQKNIEQTTKVYLDSFIRDIISGKNIEQEEVIEKVKIFDWELEFPLRLMSIRINHPDTNHRLNLYNHIIESNEINHVFLDIFPIAPENIKTVLFNGEILIFLSLKVKMSVKRELEEAAQRLIKYFQKRMNLQISFSNIVDSIDLLANEYKNLELVHEIYSSGTADSSYFIFYNELGIYKFFHAIPQKQIMYDYVKEKIGKIIAEDKRKDSELLFTLEILIKNRMNIKQSSEELFIHNNSLRYRMDLLQNLGVNLEDGYKLSEISVAIQMNDYLKIISNNYTVSS